MITDIEKADIKKIAARKPLRYDEPVSKEQVHSDCVEFVKNNYPNWTIERFEYFVQMMYAVTVTKD